MTPSTPASPHLAAIPLRLDPDAARVVREEIERAGGREVCFLVSVSEDRRLVEPRAVARGNRHAVLAAAADAVAGQVILHNHPSGQLEPSDPDLHLAARVYESGLGTAITDNLAEGLYVITEPPRPRSRTLLDLDEIDRVLGPGGPLEARHQGFEDRPAQREMARAVGRRFNEGGALVVEAGTGTGKSLAYLLPAALWARDNRERTVISTNTINLQEQLVQKDLPLLESVLDTSISWALVKGRGNYVSIRRLRLAAATAPSLFDTDRSAELDALMEWVDHSGDGSLSDLSAPPSADVWDEVRSDGDACLGTRCPHFQACFYQKARRDAASADLLVVNHALLFSDIALRSGADMWSGTAVLPPYRHVVLDEGHNVEDAATQHLGAEVSRVGVRRLLGRLERNGRGVLAAVEEAVKMEPDSPSSDGILRRLADELRPALSRARQAADRFFELLDPRAPSDREPPLRLGTGDPRDPEGDLELSEARDRLSTELGRLGRELEELRVRIEMDETRRERMEGRLLDVVAVGRRLEATRQGMGMVLDPGEQASRRVRWIEGRGSRGHPGRNVILCAAPVEPGPLLRESLFGPLDTTVVTSATLTVAEDDFRFLRNRLGIGDEAGPGNEDQATLPPLISLAAEASSALSDEEGQGSPVPQASTPNDLPPNHRGQTLDVEELALPSPFDYREQARLAIPTDLPPPSGADRSGATAPVVEAVADLTGGGVFVLFTSYRALRSMAAELRRRGVDARYPLLVHGESPRGRLLDDFIRSGRGILLGTSSFWEGVDVPGHPLRALILDKIPFRVPTEPVTQARTEALEARGKSGFGHYQLPLAALRLKQGFGRLIRSRSDRGFVLLLDQRILTARYGRRLLGALPDTPLLRGPWPEIETGLRQFHASGHEPDDSK